MIQKQKETQNLDVHFYTTNTHTNISSHLESETQEEKEKDINNKWQLNNFKNCVCHISSVKYQQSTILIANNKCQISDNHDYIWQQKRNKKTTLSTS